MLSVEIGPLPIFATLMVAALPLLAFQFYDRIYRYSVLLSDFHRSEALCAYPLPDGSELNAVALGDLFAAVKIFQDLITFFPCTLDFCLLVM